MLDADVSNHTETPNRNMYATIQIVSSAIAQKKKIRYQYYDYNLRLERILHNDGEVYFYSPYGFAWNEDLYYLLGRVDKRPDIINPIRVDLMCHVEILDEEARPAPPDFSAKKYSDKVFKMFGGEETEVTLEADKSLVRKFIDRFGNNFAITGVTKDTFHATVQVSVSPTFFGWIFQYNGLIRILRPREVLDRYMDMLIRLLDDQSSVKWFPEMGKQTIPETAEQDSCVMDEQRSDIEEHVPSEPEEQNEKTEEQDSELVEQG